MPRIVTADRHDGKMSKACWAPGRLMSTTWGTPASRSIWAKAGASAAGASESLVPWRTRKGGAPACTWSNGDASANNSGFRRRVVRNMTCSKNSISWDARRSLRFMKSKTP